MLFSILFVSWLIELNVLETDNRSVSQYSSSNTSLPTVPSEGSRGVGQVASWAVSFERLLEDPTGVHYFTGFLKSEVSAENILFWLACEKFRKIPVHQTEQLKKEASSIYNTFLSSDATSPINIDDRVRVEEKDVQNPHPDIFQKIFKLMKFDSYSRFVRSQLYQSCMLANVEGRPLPGLDSRVNLQGMMGKDKRKEKRGSWGDQYYIMPYQYQIISYLLLQVEKLVARSADGRVDKYCCVFLPDGTASLTPARPGVTIRNMLTGLCEKRGLPLKDIIIYLHGKDKKPLSLDQDSSVLKDQQMFLELRVTFAVRVAFTGKTVAVVVKSNKTLQDALAAMLQKYRLRSQDVIVSMSETGEIISMNTVVTSLANKTLILDKGMVNDHYLISFLLVFTQSAHLKVLGLSGLVELLNRAQGCSADDQRGLLKKEHLMLPQFLQLPLEEAEEAETNRSLEDCTWMQHRADDV
uniref:Regulator of G protein signaling 14a n=1 Tax=Cyprinus carpio TaxID=7962 RepID=A0A8C2E9G6_CYPCA